MLFARNGLPLRPVQVMANAVNQESQVMAIPPAGRVVEPVSTQDSLVNVFEGGLSSPSHSFVRHSVCQAGVQPEFEISGSIASVAETLPYIVPICALFKLTLSRFPLFVGHDDKPLFGDGVGQMVSESTVPVEIGLGHAQDIDAGSLRQAFPLDLSRLVAQVFQPPLGGRRVLDDQDVDVGVRIVIAPSPGAEQDCPASLSQFVYLTNDPQGRSVGVGCRHVETRLPYRQSQRGAFRCAILPLKVHVEKWEPVGHG